MGSAFHFISMDILKVRMVARMGNEGYSIRYSVNTHGGIMRWALKIKKLMAEYNSF